MHLVPGLRTLLLSGLCLLLTACGSMYKPLNAETRAKVQAVHLQVVVPQETFTFSAATPGVSIALGGGLIPALIDAGVQRSRQEGMRGKIESVLDQLLDADFRAEARAALPGALQQFPMKVSAAEVVAAVPTKKDHQSLMARLPPGTAYVRVMVHYAWDIDQRVFTTRSEVALWEAGQSAAAYRGGAIYQAKAANDADLLAFVRQEMRAAMAQTITMASLDISRPAGEAKGTRAPFSVFAPRGQPVNLQGELLSTKDKRSLVRSEDGALFSVQQ